MSAEAFGFVVELLVLINRMGDVSESLGKRDLRIYEAFFSLGHATALQPHHTSWRNKFLKRSSKVG